LQKITALALLTFAGCALSPGALTLVFPSDQDKANAAHATIVAVKPMSPTDDQCPRYLGFAQPDPNQVETSTEVDLNNGVPSSSLKHIPTGYQTLIVNVTNAMNNLILIGCRTGNIGEGVKFEIALQDVNGPPPDFSMGMDAAADGPPIDMAMHKYLQMTVTEIRASARKIQGATITIKDSASATMMGTSDATGLVKIDTVGMTPPFSITVTAPAVNGYTGAVTLTNVNPTWTASDTIAFQIPVELDPPVTSGTNSINVTISDGAGQSFAGYYIPANGLLVDQVTQAWTGTTAAITPLATGSYRLAIVDAAQTKIATNGALVSTGQTVMPTLGGTTTSDFHLYNSAFTLGIVKSTNVAYTTQQYGVMLVLPASQTQASIPIFADTTFAANNAAAPAGPVPGTPSTIQNAAVLVTELIATGTGVRAELRHQLTTPTPASDSFPTPVPDPPGVTIMPSPAMANMPFTITATPPGTFPISSAYVHVVVHDTGATPKIHWHLIAPAANPTTIVAPANVVAAGTYAVDVAFVQDFTLMDGTVQATMTDDYTKLIRVVPEQLSQSTTNLTVN
jgi:hypothetical protein